MPIVLNTTEITSNIQQYYKNIGYFPMEHDVIEVTSLVATSPNYIYTFIDQLDNDISREYRLDGQAVFGVGNTIYDTFRIAPTNVYFDLMKSGLISFRTKKGMKFEWIPTKKLYIHSIYEYIDLYNSFALYLEKIPYRNNEDKEHSSQDNIKFKICFYPLYSSESAKSNKKRSSTPISFNDYFQTTQMTIQTSNALYKADDTLRFQFI